MCRTWSGGSTLCVVCSTNDWVLDAATGHATAGEWADGRDGDRCDASRPQRVPQASCSGQVDDRERDWLRRRITSPAGSLSPRCEREQDLADDNGLMSGRIAELARRQGLARRRPVSTGLVALVDASRLTTAPKPGRIASQRRG
jgi:hypothetical protein